MRGLDASVRRDLRPAPDRGVRHGPVCRPPCFRASAKTPLGMVDPPALNTGARAFVEHLLRRHPEWAVHVAAHDPTEPGSFRIELPAHGGALSVVGQSTEALLTFPDGRERLFVWPAAEREEA